MKSTGGNLCLFLLLFFLPALSLAIEEIELRVMTFNIWYGGEQVSFHQTVEVIRQAKPDLIGIQEPDGNLKRLAEAAGYAYADEKRNIISRYPLFDPDTNDRSYPYVFVLVRPGKIVAFANTHLTSSPFGPDLIREGKTKEEVLANEQAVRLREVKPYADAVAELIPKGIPVFFAGDFNSPSHLDWTHEAAEQKLIPFPFEWPVTKILTQAGLRDSYREAHPSAVTKAGITWTPGYPHPWVKPNEIHSRIDMIWSGGKTTVLESKIVGESRNPRVDISVDPYPSDHRAVVSSFRVLPAVAPAMIMVEPRSVTEGSDFLVRFHLPDFADSSIVVVPQGKPSTHKPVVAASGPNVFSTRPTFKFGTIGIAPGTYDAVLLNSKSSELARTTFHILQKNAICELSLEKEVYEKGERIRVFFRNAPGMKNDWIGIYKAGDPDVYGGYLSFVYTGARVDGSVTIDAPEAGEYEFRLMREDSYVILAKIKFTVK